jgi:hypothetical protein
MGGLVCVIGGAGLLGLLMCGALALRAAVAVANRVVGRPEPTRPAWIDSPEDEENWDAWDEAERPRRPKKAIPEPTVGRGMAIAFAAAGVTAMLVVMFAGAIGLVVDEFFDSVNDDVRAVTLAALGLPLGFAATAALLTPMLPTTFRRAALVSFVYHAIGLVVLGAVGGAIVFVLWA